jgi:hypothetical protein
MKEILISTTCFHSQFSRKSFTTHLNVRIIITIIILYDHHKMIWIAESDYLNRITQTCVIWKFHELESNRIEFFKFALYYNYYALDLLTELVRLLGERNAGNVIDESQVAADSCGSLPCAHNVNIDTDEFERSIWVS